VKRLFHFSDDPDIACFVPRPVAVASTRAPGREWLNGPLVWAIDESHACMYLFPRDCPRILMWTTRETRPEDRERWLGDLRNGVSAVAYLERSRLAELQSGVLYRYELPPETFVDLEDAGMWVSRERVRPLSVVHVADLPSALARCGTELRVVDSLVPLREVWNSSVHASGIRLRNAAGWSG
jgi:hypothetical protein